MSTQINNTLSSHFSIMSAPTSSISQPTEKNAQSNPLNDESVIDKLLDSHAAWKNLHDLSTNIGKFLVQTRVKVAKRKLGEAKQNVKRRKQSCDGDGKLAPIPSKLSHPSIPQSLIESADEEQRQCAAVVINEMNRIERMKMAMARIQQARTYIQNEIEDLLGDTDLEAYLSRHKEASTAATMTETTAALSKETEKKILCKPQEQQCASLVKPPLPFNLKSGGSDGTRTPPSKTPEKLDVAFRVESPIASKPPMKQQERARAA